MRYLSLAAVVLIALAALVVAPSCTFRAVSPFSGKEVTAEELSAEKEAADAEARADAADLKIEADTEAKRAESLRAKARAAFDSAMRKVQAQASIQLEDLTAEYEAAQADADQAAATIAADLRRKAERITAQDAAKDAQYRAALASISARQETVANLLTAGQTIAGGFGPAGVGIASLLGLAGTVFGVKKARDAAATEQAATRVVDALDAAKLADPSFAQAFKAQAKVISEWMGPAGVALVNKAQNS